MKTHLKICNSLTQDERTLALLTAAKVPDSALENPSIFSFNVIASTFVTL
jgi:hypothetical protein